MSVRSKSATSLCEVRNCQSIRILRSDFGVQDFDLTDINKCFEDDALVAEMMGHVLRAVKRGRGRAAHHGKGCLFSHSVKAGRTKLDIVATLCCCSPGDYPLCAKSQDHPDRTR